MILTAQDETAESKLRGLSKGGPIAAWKCGHERGAGPSHWAQNTGVAHWVQNMGLKG